MTTNTTPSLTVTGQRSPAMADHLGVETDDRDLFTLDAGDGPWVQFTYNTLRNQDGGMADLWWVEEIGWTSTTADGGQEHWSDVILTFDTGLVACEVCGSIAALDFCAACGSEQHAANAAALGVGCPIQGCEDPHD